MPPSGNEQQSLWKGTFVHREPDFRHRNRRHLSLFSQGLLFEDDPIRHVPAPPAPEPRFEVGYLPGLEPPPSKLVPCALLTLWNPAPASGRHGPVPRLCRVGWAPLLAVPPDARINENVSLEIELGKLAALVNPRTVTMREDGVSGYRPTQHGPATGGGPPRFE